jgi:hypothetical protein
MLGKLGLKLATASLHGKSNRAFYFDGFLPFEFADGMRSKWDHI